MSRREVRFGLSLPNRAVLFGTPIELLLETAEQAEASGLFDSVWVGDNFLFKPRLEAVVTLGALAARTKRLKLGVICLATFPLRHPLQLAIQWASLDVISNGRTILAVCTGKSGKGGGLAAKELVSNGILSKERAPRMEEGIQLLRLFWGREPVTYEGQFYRFEEVEALPKPVQERIPIVIAVNPPAGTDPALVEKALRRVARLADGWQTDGTPPAVFKERWERVQEYAAEYGRSDEVTDSSLHLMVNINDDAAQAYREGVGFLEAYYGAGNVSEEKVKSWLAYGPPAMVIDKINEFLEAGCTTPVLRFVSSDQRGQLERCVGEVLPAFKGVTV